MRDYEHQKRTVDETWNIEGWNLFCDTGTGKTRMAIKTCERLWTAQLIDSVVVIAPGGMYRNWVNELILHSSVCYEARVWAAAYSAKRKESVFTSPGPSKLTYILMNVEAFSMSGSRAYKLLETFLKQHRCTMIIDESTSIRNPKSMRTRNLLKLGALAPYRRNLSGFPAPEKPVDLYTQCLFVRPPAKLFPFKSWYGFRNTYCVVENEAIYVQGGRLRQIAKIVGAQRQTELRQLLLNFSTLLSKRECLDLPPRTYLRREIAFSPEQDRLYATAQKEALFAIVEYTDTNTSDAQSTAGGNGNTVSVSNRMSQLEKLHQISCGLIRDSDGKWHHLANHIYDELIDQLEEINGKVVIYSCYSEQITECVKRLRHHYGEDAAAAFDGRTHPEQRAMLVAEYQNSASPLRYLVVNPATGKFGWTLTAGDTAIYLSNSYEVEPRHQSEDRLHRIGQTSDKVTYIDFVSSPIDEKILDDVRAKRSIGAEIMGAGWEELLYGRRVGSM